ncbi:MAG: DUF3418 domain-containing protein [Phycisphaerales bacterium]
MMAAEIVQTTRIYARTVTKVHPWWIEEAAGHLVERTYTEPHWNADRARVDAFEKVTLFGLEIVPRRAVHYGPIDPRASRDLFIHHALVLGEYVSKAPFCVHNAELIVHVRSLEARARTSNLLASPEKRYDFFHQRVPAPGVAGGAASGSARSRATVYNAETFEAWRREAERRDPRVLFMSPGDVMDERLAERITPEAYPGAIGLGARADDVGRASLEYRYEPGHPDDGVTAIIPVEALSDISQSRAEWLVPGLLPEKVTELIRSLPKEYRVRFVPAPEFAARCVPLLGPADTPLTEAIAQTLLDLTGVHIPADAWRSGDLPPYLLLNFRVVDAQGKAVASGRDLATLKRDLRARLRDALAEIRDERYNRRGVKTWDFGTLPERAEVVSRGLTITGYPAIVDGSWDGAAHGSGHERAASSPGGGAGTVSLRLLDSLDAARAASRAGVRRLYAIAMEKELAFTLRNLPGYQRLVMHFASLGSPEQLRAELSDFIVERAFMKSDEAVRSEAQFRARLDPGWSDLARVSQECAALAGEILAAYQPVASLVGFRREGLTESKRAASATFVPEAWTHAAEDIRAQLSRLMRPWFLVDTPAPWLVHYPRYLSGIRLRWEKLQSHGTDRDARSLAQIEPLEREWEARRIRDAERGGGDAALSHVRWMLEELRVSLFAQELRTAVAVSVKRVSEQLRAAGGA